MIQFDQKTIKECPIYKSKKSILTKEECENLKSFFTDKLEVSLTSGGYNPSNRNALNSWIPFSETWLYERIASAVKELNVWEIDVAGFHEQIQISSYIEGSYYHLHRDWGDGAMSNRKLSAVIQLSDPSDYEGGRLEFAEEHRLDDIKEQGTLILFPSFTPHRAREILSGVRWSLAVWLSGPSFK